MWSFRTYLWRSRLHHSTTEDSGDCLVAPANAEDLLRWILDHEVFNKLVDIQYPLMALSGVYVAASKDDQVERGRVRELAFISSFEER